MTRFLLKLDAGEREFCAALRSQTSNRMGHVLRPGERADRSQLGTATGSGLRGQPEERPPSPTSSWDAGIGLPKW
jgi:hypothetical protein